MSSSFTLIIPTNIRSVSQAAFIYQVVLGASCAKKGLEITCQSSGHPSIIINSSTPCLVAKLKTGDIYSYSDSVSAVKQLLCEVQLSDLSLDEAEALSNLSLSTPKSLVAKIIIAGEALAASCNIESKAEWIKDLLKENEEAINLVAPFFKSSSLTANRTNIKEGVSWEYDWNKVRLPEAGKRNILITAALPYVNNVPHLGNIIGAVLSADVYARYCRLRGYQTLYICGTDEYGTATETKALEEGIGCADLCAKYFKLHAGIYEWFGISTDYFGRTSTAKQTEITHEIFQGLYSNGYFFEETVEQVFCETCSRFLADRYVEGTCPLCGYADARGDQCDACGKLINPTDLKDPKCKVCHTTPTVKSSSHLFLDLSKLQPVVDAFVEKQSGPGLWSSNSLSISKAWLTEGLKPRCMTRDLKWGTPVPVKGFEDKVFYVWFDACFGYISITAGYTDEWRQWWQCNAKSENPKVELVQFMGKDNVPFHTVIFPSTLIGTAQKEESKEEEEKEISISTPWTLLHHINTTEYLNYENGKFSKSRCIGVFGNDARDSGIPVSVWRYYLLSVRPESTDTAFSWNDFGSRNNNELLSNLGNFVSRVTKFTTAKFDGIVPALEEITEVDQKLIDSVNAELKVYLSQMEKVQLRAALKTAMSISSLGNGYLTEAGLDNKLLASDPSRCHTIIALSLNLVYLLAAIFEPFIPSTAADIRAILNAPSCQIPSEWDYDVLRQGHQLDIPFHLFTRLDNKKLAELRSKFAGKQVQ